MAGPRKSTTEKLRELQLLGALVSEPTLARAALVAKCSERTVRRALKRPGFARRVLEARKAAVESAVSSLAGLAAEAHDAVKRALVCGNAAVELKAALAILLEAPIRGGEFLFALNELKTLQEQLAELIDRQQGGTG
jgi:hypothetical protein